MDTCSAAPTAFDRLLAGRSGADAVKRLAAGAAGLLVGLVGTRIRATPLAEAVASTKTLAPGLIRLARVLAA